MRDALVGQAVDRLGSALAVLDSEGSVVDATEAWKQLDVTGTVPAAAAVGEPFPPACEAIADGETAERARAVVDALLAGERDQGEIAYDLPREDALPRRFRLQGHRFTAETETYVAVEHTERTAASRTEQERDHYRETLADVATVVSHDIRSPLTAALSWTELLAADPDADTEKLDRVTSGLERTNAIADTAVTLARETAVEEVEPVTVDSVAARVWDRIDARGTTLDTEETGQVLADERALEVLLKNLLRNAVQHSIREDGTTDREELTVSVGPLPDGFYVADDGAGVEEGLRDNLFEAGVTTGSADENTGIGLAIVERAAEAHGWTVELAEAGTGGARFEITGVVRPPSATGG
jgi:signal transduction histidine kinase